MALSGGPGLIYFGTEPFTGEDGPIKQVEGGQKGNSAVDNEHGEVRAQQIGVRQKDVREKLGLDE